MKPIAGRMTTGRHADMEMQAQADMQERGRRLRAAKAIADANTIVVDGDALAVPVEGFSWTRQP